jgi:hypothetical protein
MAPDLRKCPGMPTSFEGFAEQTVLQLQILVTHGRCERIKFYATPASRQSQYNHSRNGRSYCTGDKSLFGDLRLHSILIIAIGQRLAHRMAVKELKMRTVDSFWNRSIGEQVRGS